MIHAALFDVDGTLVNGRVWRGIFEYPGVSPSRVRLVYARALPRLVRLKLQPGYETRFRDQWVRSLAWLLKGWRVQHVDDMADWMAEYSLDDLYRQDVVGLVQYHKSEGHPVILVSTMFPPVLEAIARRVDADAVVGTELEVHGDVLTGDIVGASCVGERKLAFAERYLASHLPGITMAECAGYADSFSDVPLLNATAQSCAVYPDPLLRQAAIERGWRIHPER